MKTTSNWIASLTAAPVMLVLAGCGDAPAAGSAAAAAALAPAAAAPAGPALTSEQACALLTVGQVEAILGMVPNATPHTSPQADGITQARCTWNAGLGKAELSLTVTRAESDLNRMLIANTPLAGEALAGIGDQAAVDVQGNYSVDVEARLGPQLVTLGAMGMGITDRRDAVVAAARSAVAKLQ